MTTLAAALLLAAAVQPRTNAPDVAANTRRLAESGNVRAQVTVAELAFQKGDMGEAFRWFSAAAENGDPAAQVRLADLYLAGRGTLRDAAQAAHWYAMAVSHTPEAQWKLGALFQQGDGVAQNPEIAAAMFRRAADQGYADAQNSLGSLYIAGIGVKQDLNEAVKWFRKAAEQGCGDAQVNLATLYLNGVGVQQSLVVAREWARKAQSSRPREAGEILAEIDRVQPARRD